MSFNQSRSDKNETQYRKTGRSASSNQQYRGYSPSYPKGTGAGGPGPSISSNRSFKKNNNNAQGGQSRASVTTVNTQDSGIAFAQRGGVQNGAHVQPQLHGGSDAPVASTASRTAEASASQRSSRTVPKAPTSQSASVTSDTRTPTTPAKPPGDASKGFAFQFGSISPGFMNGMQIPARTSSAPPNLDEQKRDQARHDSFRAVPSVPVPTVPKQQLPRKDSASIDQPNAAEVHMVPKVKKDVQVSHALPPSQTQKPSAHSMAGMSMPMPFHQPQVPVQFGGPNQQIQSQSMSASSIQLPMPIQLPIGSTQVQQPVFVQGLQPHPMQPQGIMHQGQNMTFTPQMGPQIPQMGNLGVSMASQCPQQQGRRFGGPRKTPVKITHPDTHEELRLDKRTDSCGMDASLSRSDSMGGSEVFFSKSSKLEQHSASVQTTELSGGTSKTETEGTCEENIGGGGGNIENIGSGGDSLTMSDFRDKPELSRTKSTISMRKKKRKEILSKKKRTEIVSKADAVGREKDAPVKAEPEDWEDAADISTPKLETSDTGEQVRGVDDSDKDGHEHGAKKYSRDFLLKYSVQFTELPEGFEITSDIAQNLNANVNAAPSIVYDSLPSPGRIVDRQGGAARLDRRGQGPNFGVLGNPRAPTPVQQHVRGILPGPAHSVGPQGGMQRNNSDADRWPRDTNFQPKGLMPSPHAPLQVMHKADRKYEVGKVSDEEQAKQRQLKAILNKLTPQNFEKLFEQVKAVNIDNATTLTGVISQIFDKALVEPTFCEMYANFCFYLAGELPDFSEDNEKITFMRLLLNKCQEEFERGGREQEETNKADEEGQVKQSEEEREEKRIKARRRMLGNIRLIGELYKKKMLTERIMHECIKKLLGRQQTADEEDIEALCKLMSTIGEMIDHPKAKEHMDVYFERMKSLSNNMRLSSRVRFMLKDAIDLRKKKWQQRRKVEGRIKIEEVHRDAAQERQAESTRLARGPGINPSARRGPPMEFSPRGSTMLSSPNAHIGGFRGMPAQVRGHGSRDVRTDERHSYESRTLSVPLTQRPIGDDSITLGTQGGLARGMSIRGPPSMSAAPLADMPPSAGDSRRMTAGSNGFSSLSERTTYNPREDPVPRYMSDRFSGPAAYDQSSVPKRNLSFGGRDLRSSDHRTLPTSPPTRAHGATLTQNVPSENVLTEDRLRDMSLAAIKEFYSARDEKEVASCIKELNSPCFHPSMISLWVTDSFERKDAERDLLAKLLVNLTKTHGGTLSQPQLIKGFATVLFTLEDAVNDAPRAPEFLGFIFAKVILENVISLNQIGQLIQEGGEWPGHLLEVGLAGNVLGSVLEIIKSGKGDSGLNEIRTSSNLRLETFRPPDPLKSRILEKFI